MSTITPSPRTWTLRFKQRRTTVLIHADPLQRWPLLRADLLRALHQTHPDGFLHHGDDDTDSGGVVRIPTDPADVRLAKPVDPHDLSLGWVALGEADQRDFLPADDASALHSAAAGKGKAKVGALATTAAGGGAGKAGLAAAAGMKDCPQGAGLREGSVLAFKFRGQAAAGKGKGGRRGGQVDDEDDEEAGLRDDGALVGDLEEPEVWDVVLPSYEETYNEEEEMPDVDDVVRRRT